MKITKYGHCCLLIEENGVFVLTDPGSYTKAQNDVKNIDIILITHEHGDHLHIDSVKEIVKNNPEAIIVTNASVAKILKDENIESKIVAHGDEETVKGIRFRGFGTEHALIHTEWAIVENTGYFIGERLFYPGDAFTDPHCPIDILALPVAGPWMKISEAIDYAIAVSPKKYFGVHDGGLNENGGGVVKRVAPQIIAKHGIEYVNLEIGIPTEL